MNPALVQVQAAILRRVLFVSLYLIYTIPSSYSWSSHRLIGVVAIPHVGCSRLLQLPSAVRKELELLHGRLVVHVISGPTPVSSSLGMSVFCTFPLEEPCWVMKATNNSESYQQIRLSAVTTADEYCRHCE